MRTPSQQLVTAALGGAGGMVLFYVVLDAWTKGPSESWAPDAILLAWSAFVLVSASLGLPLLWTLLELRSIAGSRWRAMLFGPLCGLIGFACLAAPEALEGLDGARFTPAFVALCAGTIGGAVFAGLAGGRGRRYEHP